MEVEFVCPFCGGSFDGNEDCPNYCAYNFCGVCQREVERGHTHRRLSDVK